MVGLEPRDQLADRRGGHVGVAAEIVFHDVIGRLERVAGDGADLRHMVAGERQPGHRRVAQVLVAEVGERVTGLDRLGPDCGEDMAIVIGLEWPPLALIQDDMRIVDPPGAPSRLGGLEPGLELRCRRHPDDGAGLGASEQDR